MSTAMKINEAPVIDIGTDTQLLAIGADGKVGKGKFPALVQQSKEKGFPFVEQGDWWRIANIDACGVGILCIREKWSQSAPTPVVLGIAVDAYPGGSQVNADAIKVLAGRSNRITKVRVVIDAFNKAKACWIDVCVPHADIYKYRATQVAALGLGIKPVEIAEAPSVDSAYQVREYDMATLTQSGGVICCTSVGPYRVTVTLKGGPHEPGKSADRRASDGFAASDEVYDREDVQASGYNQYRHRHADRTDIGHGVAGHAPIGSHSEREHGTESCVQLGDPVSILVRLVGDTENPCTLNGVRNPLERMVSSDARTAADPVITRKEVVAA